MEQEPHPFGAQLRQRHNQIVMRFHILFRRLEELESRAPGPEQRRDDEVEFTVRETMGKTISTQRSLTPNALSLGTSEQERRRAPKKRIRRRREFA